MNKVYRVEVQEHEEGYVFIELPHDSFWDYIYPNEFPNIAYALMDFIDSVNMNSLVEKGGYFDYESIAS